MRLPRVRFTVRRLIVAVAIVAGMLQAILMNYRYLHCWTSAEHYAMRSESRARSAEGHGKSGERYAEWAREAEDRSPGLTTLWNDSAARERDEAARDSAEAIRMAEASEAFRRVASRPWVAIPPHPREDP
jgi:hypothetical protein